MGGRVRVVAAGRPRRRQLGRMARGAAWQRAAGCNHETKLGMSHVCVGTVSRMEIDWIIGMEAEDDLTG